MARINSLSEKAARRKARAYKKAIAAEKRGDSFDWAPPSFRDPRLRKLLLRLRDYEYPGDEEFQRRAFEQLEYYRDKCGDLIRSRANERNKQKRPEFVNGGKMKVITGPED